jgi:predicted transcriptional regulator
MSTPQLRPNQRRILQSLVELVDDETPLVSGEDIAADIGRNPGTIRNQMQSLSALQLVEGVPGPRGGYKPTAAVYRALDSERLDDPADVPVAQNDQAVHDVNVEKIDFVTVHNPNQCRAEVTVRGSVHHFAQGEHVTLGPTPATELRISGTVDGVDPATNTITLDINRLNTATEHLTAD